MPFTAGLLSKFPYILILRIRTTAAKGWRTGAPPLAYVAVLFRKEQTKGASVEERISRRRFIRLGTALGVGAAGASVLAACGGSGGGGGDGGGSDDGGGPGGGGGYRGEGGGGGSNESPGKKTGGGSKGTQVSGGQAIAQTSEVAPGSALKFENSGQPAVLVHLQSGDFVAYSAVCTHQQCTVAYRNRQLVCPCHGSVFDPANGAEVVHGPAQLPLPEIPVKVRGREVVRT
jgi:cytochrome b6-f complex iron-sulfur subunit